MEKKTIKKLSVILLYFSIPTLLGMLIINIGMVLGHFSDWDSELYDKITYTILLIIGPGWIMLWLFNWANKE